MARFAVLAAAIIASLLTPSVAEEWGLVGQNSRSQVLRGGSLPLAPVGAPGSPGSEESETEAEGPDEDDDPPRFLAVDAGSGASAAVQFATTDPVYKYLTQQTHNKWLRSYQAMEAGSTDHYEAFAAVAAYTGDVDAFLLEIFKRAKDKALKEQPNGGTFLRGEDPFSKSSRIISNWYPGGNIAALMAAGPRFARVLAGTDDFSVVDDSNAVNFIAVLRELIDSLPQLMDLVSTPVKNLVFQAATLLCTPVGTTICPAVDVNAFPLVPTRDITNFPWKIDTVVMLLRSITPPLGMADAANFPTAVREGVVPPAVQKSIRTISIFLQAFANGSPGRTEVLANGNQAMSRVQGCPNFAALLVDKYEAWHQAYVPQPVPALTTPLSLEKKREYEKHIYLASWRAYANAGGAEPSLEFKQHILTFATPPVAEVATKKLSGGHKLMQKRGFRVDANGFTYSKGITVKGTVALNQIRDVRIYTPAVKVANVDTVDRAAYVQKERKGRPCFSAVIDHPPQGGRTVPPRPYVFCAETEADDVNMYMAACTLAGHLGTGILDIPLVPTVPCAYLMINKRF